MPDARVLTIDADMAALIEGTRACTHVRVDGDPRPYQGGMMQVRKLLMIGAISLLLLRPRRRRRVGSFLRSSAATSAAMPISATSRMTTSVERRMDFGANLGWNPNVVGFEVDFGYSPNFFEDTAGDRNFEFGDSNVTTLMGNVLIGAPAGQRLPSVASARPRPDPRERAERHRSVQRSVDQRSRHEHRRRPQRAVQRQRSASAATSAISVRCRTTKPTTSSICRSAASTSGAARSADVPLVSLDRRRSAEHSSALRLSSTQFRKIVLDSRSTVS